MTTFTNDLPDDLDAILKRLSACDGTQSDATVITWEKCQVLVREVTRLRDLAVVYEKNLTAINNVCALAGIGSRGQTILDRVKQMHETLGQQIERADAAEKLLRDGQKFLVARRSEYQELLNDYDKSNAEIEEMKRQLEEFQGER